MGWRQAHSQYLCRQLWEMWGSPGSFKFGSLITFDNTALEFVTQGVVKATYHRVLSPPAGSIPRYSVPMFQGTRLDMYLTDEILDSGFFLSLQTILLNVLSWSIVSEVPPEILKLKELREDPIETNSEWLPTLLRVTQTFLYTTQPRKTTNSTASSQEISSFFVGSCAQRLISCCTNSADPIFCIGVILTSQNGFIRISSRNTSQTGCRNRLTHTEIP